MKALEQWLTKLIDIIIFFLFSLMVIVVFMQVILRYLFDMSLAWASEFSQYAMVWMTFLGAALAVKGRDHTRVDYFIQLFPRAWYKYINVLINVVIMIFLIFLIYTSLPVVKAAMQDITPGLGIPYGLVSLSLLVGEVLMIVYLVSDSVKWLKKGMDEEE